MNERKRIGEEEERKRNVGRGEEGRGERREQKKSIVYNI
jgi:hypothetical protein